MAIDPESSLTTRQAQFHDWCGEAEGNARLPGGGIACRRQHRARGGRRRRGAGGMRVDMAALPPQALTECLRFREAAPWT